MHKLMSLEAFCKKLCLITAYSLQREKRIRMQQVAILFRAADRHEMSFMARTTCGVNCD